MRVFNSESQSVEDGGLLVLEPTNGYHRMRIHNVFTCEVGVFVRMHVMRSPMGQQMLLFHYIADDDTDSLIHFMKEFNISQTTNHIPEYEWPGHTGVAKVCDNSIISIGVDPNEFR